LHQLELHVVEHLVLPIQFHVQDVMFANDLVEYQMSLLVYPQLLLLLQFDEYTIIL
jgi:hypothetical protein